MRAVSDVANCPVLQGVRNHVDLLGVTASLLGTLIVIDGLGVDDDLDSGRMIELTQFEGRELGLGGAASSEDVDLDGLVVLEALVDVGGDLGGEKFVAGLGEDTGDIEGDVADTEDSDLLGFERPRTRYVGVAVVPGDEVGCAVAAIEVDAGDVQCAVGVCAGGEDDGVVEAAEIIQGDVGAVVDVAEEADLRLVEDLVQGGDDALDAGVVGGNAVADEAEGRRHAFEEVDAHVCVGLHEGVGGIDAGWSGADDGNAERTSLVSHVQRTTFVDGKCGHPSIN